MTEDVLVFAAIFGVVYLGFNLWGTILVMEIARVKGHSGVGAAVFCLCFFLGIIGYLFVIALPDKRAVKQNEQIIELLKGSTAGSPSDEASLPAL